MEPLIKAGYTVRQQELAPLQDIDVAVACAEGERTHPSLRPAVHLPA